MNDPRCRFLALLPLVLLLWAGDAAAVWKPVRPDGEVGRYRLVPVADAGGETYTRSSYVLLAAGETVAYTAYGTGRVRVKARPVIPGSVFPGHFRLAVCFDDTTCRRFKRLSAPQGEFLLEPLADAPAIETLRLGTENTLDLDTPGVVRSVTVRNRSHDDRALLVRLLVDDGLSRPRFGDDEPADEAARSAGGFAPWADPLQLGYDSNAYRAPADANDNRAELFWPVRAGLDVDLPAGEEWDLEAGYSFSGRIYGQSVLNEYRHRLKASQRWRPDGAADWTFAVEEHLATKQSTFFGRGDEAELETVTDTGDTLSLADRFDSVTFRVTPSVRWRWNSEWSATFALRWQLRDYFEDYADHDDIYALDYLTTEPQLEIDWRPRRDLRVGAEAALADKRYAEKFSRDAAGVEIRTVDAHYVKTSALAFVDWGRRTGPQAGGEVKYYANDDRYAGYWDYSGVALEVSGGWRWRDGSRVELKARRSETDYDRSHVANDPAQPLRAKSVWNLRAAGEMPLPHDFTLVARLHYKDYDYNSRNFAYTRLLAQGGVRWGF